MPTPKHVELSLETQLFETARLHDICCCAMDGASS